MITSVKKRRKKFEICIGDILRRKGTERAKMIYRISRFLKFCLSYKADFMLTTRARSIDGVRTPKEISMIGTLLGLTEDQAKFAISF